MTRSRTTADPLPPPTPSEAAFERVLEAFDGDSPAAFVERLFAQRERYLERDPYASIGEATHFYTKAVGVSFEGRQDVVAGLQPGYELTLERQPENEHDPCAIAVRYGALQIGFLRRAIARRIAPQMDAGVRYRVRIASLTGAAPGSGADAQKFRGVNLLVEREYAPAAAAGTGESERTRRDRDEIRRALIGERRPRESQRAVLERIEAGRNTLAVLGTGRGKSFCFQYPAAYRALEAGQKTLVLYPLRALANDQYEALQRRLGGFGLRIYRANGAISGAEREEVLHALAQGSWDVVLSTPEFLHYHRAAFCGASTPALVVVDEAHHLFESKHRPAYGVLGRTIASLGDPQVIALTATAGDDAFAHIVRELRIDAWVVDPTVRENLRVVDARGRRDKGQKIAYLRDLFAGGGKSIVYCTSRSEATEVAQALRGTLGDVVAFYHAGMPTPERAQVETYFREGALRVVVATSAFGEGIDLPDVRNVVLYHLNFDFTEFNQQAGRAGRDGEDAAIHLLFGEPDRRINDYIIDRQAPTIHVLRELYKGLRGLARDGFVRLSFVDAARTLNLAKADERTIAAAVRIFEDEGLVESGEDDDGRYIRFLPVDGKVDLRKNERFAEGEAEREAFARFCDLVLGAGAGALERIVNRPIYPERVPLER